MKSISVERADPLLASLLDRVAHGETVVFEDGGKAVALLSPPPREMSKTTSARAALDRRLRQQHVQPLVDWTRGDLYDR